MPKPRHDSGQAIGSRRDGVARQRVGVDRRDAKLVELRANVALAGGDPVRSEPTRAVTVSATNGWPTPRRRSAQGISHQHRDRERANAAWNGRQSPGHIGDVRMNVADKHRPFRTKDARAAGGLRGNSDCATAGSVTLFIPTSTTVAPGLTKSRRHKPRPSRPPRPGCRRSRQTSARFGVRE